MITNEKISTRVSVINLVAVRSFITGYTKSACSGLQVAQEYCTFQKDRVTALPALRIKRATEVETIQENSLHRIAQRKYMHDMQHIRKVRENK